MRSSLWCILLLFLLKDQSSARRHREHVFSSRLRGLQQQQQQAQVSSMHNSDLRIDASSRRSLPTIAPTLIEEQIQDPTKPKIRQDPKEIVPLPGSSPAEWTRYRDRSQSIPSLSPSSTKTPVLHQQEVVSTAIGTTPSSAPTDAKAAQPSNGSKANDDLENTNSNDSSDFDEVQTAKVGLKSNQNSVMMDEDISIFEQVCETEFLPIYLPRVYAAADDTTISYTDIKCIVIEQQMLNRSHLDDKRILLQEELPQQQQQIANVQLDSDTFSTLLQILSTVNLPANDSLSFTDIVAQTFMEYSYAFQEQLSQQTDYFVSKQPETGKPDGLKEEEQTPTTTANNSLPVAVKVALGVGGFALAAVLLALFVRSMLPRNKKKQNMSPVVIARDESLVSCIEPSEGQEVVFTKHNNIIDEDETETEIDDIMLDDTASEVCRRILNETKDDQPMTRIGINSNNKPVEVITGASRSQASDVSSVTQASIGSSANINNNSPCGGSVESSQSYISNLLSQFAKSPSISCQRSKEGLVVPANEGDEEEGLQGEAAAFYPMPQTLDHPASAQFGSNASSGFGGGDINLPVTEGSMLSLGLYSLADSISSVAITAKTASNLSSMLGDLTTNGSGGDDIVFSNSGVETSLSGFRTIDKSHDNVDDDKISVQ